MSTPNIPATQATEGLLRPAIVLFVLLSLVTGLLYPLAVTGIARAAFAQAANGSLLMHDGQAVGSALIGQTFSEPGHFWGRPSATAPMSYNAAASGGSNLGPTNPALIESVESRIGALRAADPGNAAPLPVDRWSWSPRRQAARIRTSVAPPPTIRSPGSRGLARYRSPRCCVSSTGTPNGLCWAFLASRESTCWN